MAYSLDSILNIAIPIAIVCAFIGLFYWKLKEPADMFFKWIGKILGQGFDSVAGALSNTKQEITYK